MAAGADVNARAGDGSTALHWAAQNDDLALADLLIRKGAKVDAATDLGVTPLWIAAANAEHGHGPASAGRPRRPQHRAADGRHLR